MLLFSVDSFLTFCTVDFVFGQQSVKAKDHNSSFLIEKSVSFAYCSGKTVFS